MTSVTRVQRERDKGESRPGCKRGWRRGRSGREETDVMSGTRTNGVPETCTTREVELTRKKGGGIN